MLPFVIMALSKTLENTLSLSGVYKFVVAVDIGTSYTKVAWTLTKNPKLVNVYDKWPGTQGNTQVPTAVLYEQRSDDWVFVAFGQDAIRQHTLVEESCLFKTFKMTLHEKKVHGRTP